MYWISELFGNENLWKRACVLLQCEKIKTTAVYCVTFIAIVKKTIKMNAVIAIFNSSIAFLNLEQTSKFYGSDSRVFIHAIGW